MQLYHPDSNTELVKKINDALHIHASWRVRIKKAIATGTFSSTPEQLLRETDCDLGRWLHYELSKEDKCAEYHTVLQAHREFHRALSDVIRSVFDGKPQEAQSKIGAGSDFARLSAIMNRELTKWIGRLSH
jgi:hypothetical protein